MRERGISAFAGASYNMFVALGSKGPGQALSQNEPASNEAPAHMQANHDSVSLTSQAQAMLSSNSIGKGGLSDTDDSGSANDGATTSDSGDGEGGESGSFLISGGPTGFIAVGEGDSGGEGDGGDGGGDGGDGGD
mgnify:FL=1